MEMHQLRYFVAVAQTKCFSRAAEACFVSQPSLSQQIAKLEATVGHRLLACDSVLHLPRRLPQRRRGLIGFAEVEALH